MIKKPKEQQQQPVTLKKKKYTVFNLPTVACARKPLSSSSSSESTSPRLTPAYQTKKNNNADTVTGHLTRNQQGQKKTRAA
jgi:hypothetical protein